MESRTESWFVSDVHVNDVRERNGENLLRFLLFLEQRQSEFSLYLLGDIFDIWVADHAAFAEKYEPIIASLRRLKNKTRRILFIEGNHDVHIHRFFRDQLGIEVAVEAQFIYEQGLQIRLEHGDLINTEDAAYLRYRRFIRSGFMKFLAHILPGSFWRWLGERASRTSRGYSASTRLEHSEEMRAMIRAHSRRVYAERPFDAIITGHMHVRDHEKLEIDGKKIESFNLGSWLGGEMPILHLKNQQFSWYEFTEKN